MIERLMLVRHGETVDNLRGIAQGWGDSDLSEKGRAQVDRVAARIATLEPTLLFCSTLPRAVSTAEAIGRAVRLEPQKLEDLREMNCGDWEGVPFLEVRSVQPDAYRKWVDDPRSPCPGGESWHDVRVRMEQALEQIRACIDGSPQNVVVVSHGTAIRVFATALLGVSIEVARSLAQDNAALNLFEWRNDRWLLRTWNDRTHCEGL
ncbi:MAG TPA: histidine phosphatase family protein [Thermoanaerobaculia bacterium]|nr:histidine phosphatase family protein [Thermoanaerobaculia bacterium]